MKKHTVYLADLTYDTLVIPNDSLPIGIGYVASYALKYIPDHFTFELFKFPNDLWDAIDKKPPEILGLSYFVWNTNLGITVARYYKRKYPQGIVVLGGANVPLKPDRQKELLMQNPFVDILIPFDGELGFLELLKRYHKCEGQKDDMYREEEIPGCTFIDNKNTLKAGGYLSRPKNIDEIPSPYLTGLLDSFFENEGLIPLIQTTRGCPFKCTYCWAGNRQNSHVRHFSIKRVLAELDYVVLKRQHSINRLLSLADSNFGMYAKDKQIADKIAQLQHDYDFPSSFNSTCGQHNKDFVLQMLQTIKKPSATISIQSTDVDIQKNVKRRPINIDHYKNLVLQLKKLEIPVKTEIITGLPGETRQTHLQTINDLLAIGFDEIHAFTFMLLEGAQLSETQFQDQYLWEKRYRIIPCDFGQYRGEKIFEIETVGVGSKTMTFDDYIYLRGFHGALMMLFNNAVFAEFVNYLRQRSVDIYKFSLFFYENLKTEKSIVGDQFRSFMTEAKEELWESKEALVSYYQKTENYQKLVSGEKGDNLLGKYKAILITDNFIAWSDYFYNQSLKYLADTKKLDLPWEKELIDIKNHVIGKCADVLTVENSIGKIHFTTLNHDIFKWKKENYIKPLSDYKTQNRLKAAYKINDNNCKIVKEILALHPKVTPALWRDLSYRYYMPATFRIGTVIA